MVTLIPPRDRDEPLMSSGTSSHPQQQVTPLWGARTGRGGDSRRPPPKPQPPSQGSFSIGIPKERVPPCPRQLMLHPSLFLPALFVSTPAPRPLLQPQGKPSSPIPMCREWDGTGTAFPSHHHHSPLPHSTTIHPKTKAVTPLSGSAEQIHHISTSSVPIPNPSSWRSGSGGA